MILLADLKNTSFSVALYSDRKVRTAGFRIYPDRTKSESEYIATLLQFFSLESIRKEEIEGAILSSVIPSLTKRIQSAISKATGKQCLLLSRKLKTGIAIRTDSPGEVGSDLIASAVGAVQDYGKDMLIVSLSSVLSFSLVTEKKEFLGCSLFPGLRLSSEAMWNSAAQLMDIDLSIPTRLIGKSTKESMNAGIVGGYLTLIRHFSEDIEKQYGKPLCKVLTGTDMGILQDALLSEFECNADLTFDGLYEIYIKNKENYLR